MTIASKALPGWNSAGSISVGPSGTLGVVLGANTATSWSSSDLNTLIGNVNWSPGATLLGSLTAPATYSGSLTPNIGFRLLVARKCEHTSLSPAASARAKALPLVP